MADTPSGNLYVKLYRNRKQKQDVDTTRENLIDGLKNLLRSEHRNSLNCNGVSNWDGVDDDTWDEVLDEILEAILPEDSTRALYLSNCSSRKRDCRLGECPLETGEEEKADCVLTDNDCSMMLVRPKCDIPSLDEMFPKSEILALKCFVSFCPYRDGGAVLSARQFTWAPKSDCRPFEVEVDAYIHWDSTAPWENRPDNLLVPQLFQNLPAMSLKTKECLKDWQDYLDWRTRLINANKRGIRYLGYRFVPESGNVVFCVAAESQAKFMSGVFWKNKTTYAYPLTNSDNPWEFHEIEDRKAREWGKPLGDFVRQADEVTSPELEDCPWDTPYVTGLVFELHDDVLSAFIDYKDANGDNADLLGWLEREVVFPSQGFLSISAVGDESLLRRLKKTLDTFSTEGSVAAPFLSSYLFDISQARLPNQQHAIEEWQNPNMNDAQKQAVQTMLDAPDIAMIQGPPGTGKTTVIAEAIYQFVKQGKKVLLASQSNAAVINALERLADLPEIRPINLVKKNKDDSRQNDNQYDENNILEDFYGNLGDKVRKILDEWRRNTEYLKNVMAYNERLSMLRDRLVTEQQLIDKAAEQMVAKRSELTTAEKAFQANNRLLAQQAAGHAFVVNLLADNTSPLEDCKFDDVPPAVIKTVESCLLPIVSDLEARGIRLLPEKYDSDVTNDICCGWLKLVFDKIGELLDGKIGQFSKDLKRLQGMTGDTVTSLEDSLKIAELDQDISKLKEAMERADDDNDEDLYNDLRKKIKSLRNQKKELEISGSLSKEAYGAVFNTPDKDGRMWSEYITSPGRKRTELMAILSRFDEFFQKIADSYKAGAVKIQNDCNAYLSSLKIDEHAMKNLKHAEAEYDKTVTARNEANQRRQDFVKSANQLLLEMMNAIGLPENAAKSVEDTCNWCAQAIDALQRRERENEAPKKLSPIFEKWLNLLSNPNSSDKEQVLDTYLKNCSVVGLTCSADPKLLTERGYDHFEVVIIDEVSKTTPPELLLSMVMAEKAILVGDHRQLPPLFGDREPLAFEEIVQRDAEDDSIPGELKITEENFRKYKKMVVASLFKEHFEKAHQALKSMLWIQYRMHPDIMDVINEFYENRLVCGLNSPDVDRNHNISSREVEYIQDNGHAYWIDSSRAPDGNFWPDVKSGTSFENYLEAALIFETLVQLDKALCGKKKNNQPIKKTVGIISFYGRQAGLLKRMKKRYHFTNFNPRIETVDRFQGQERDYVLVSMTRNPKDKSVRGKNSFMAQFERINVAFSRARELLLIYGARDMCAPYEISLPPLMGGTKVSKHKVYQRIIASLDRKGCLVQPYQIISKEEWANLKTYYKPPRASLENADVKTERPPRRTQKKNFGY